MTFRERYRATFAYSRVDRPMLDFVAEPEVLSALLEHFGTADPDVVLDALGADTRVLAPRYVGPELEPAPLHPSPVTRTEETA